MTKQRCPELAGLREKRIFRQMSQQQAANILGMTQSHYRQIEAGVVRLDIHRAKKLADAFDCTIEDLM